MSNEEFERKVAFIIEHQAQFASDIQQLREIQSLNCKPPRCKQSK